MCSHLVLYHPSPTWTQPNQNISRFVSLETSIFMKLKKRTVPYLYLSVVTDGFDRCCASQGALCPAGAELHHNLGPAHQACDRTPVLNQLFLLLLQGRGKPDITSCSGPSQSSDESNQFKSLSIIFKPSVAEIGRTELMSLPANSSVEG